MNLQNIEKLQIRKLEIRSQIEECVNIYEYPKLKSALESLDEEIAKATGTLSTFHSIRTLRARIDELETKLIRINIEKKECMDIQVYRGLLDRIQTINEAIEFNKSLLQKLVG